MLRIVEDRVDRHDPSSHPAAKTHLTSSTERQTPTKAVSVICQQSLSLYHELDQHGLRLENDGFIKWKDDEPQLPRNWSTSKKAYNDILVCFFEFWMTAVSSSGTAASDAGRVEYGINRTLGYFTFTSIYLLGQATGSVFCSPISETFGRRTLYILSIAVYCLFSAVIAVIPSDIAVCFGRFITGAASAIPATVAFGTFEDMHSSETRIWIVYIYTLVGNCGLVLGPIYSAYVSTYAGWRWVFYISTIVCGFGIIASIFMHETRTGYLLEMKVNEMHKRIGYENFRIPTKKKITIEDFVIGGLFRPVQFLFTEPIVICCALLMMISFSLIYGLTEGLPVVYTQFGFSEATTSSLAFIPLLIGLVTNVTPRLYDQHVFDNHRERNIAVCPETKIRSMVTSCPSLAIGMWLFAWTIPPQVLNVHWIVSMMGLVFIGYATNDLAYILFGYLTDSYGQYAASACAALSLSRTLMAAVFPLFTYTIYSGLGGNVSTSIFAVIATLFCITPVILIKYGRQIRRMSRFAKNDENDGIPSDQEKGIQRGLS